MRMEELSDSRYIKSPDSVEKYLLNLVKGYFRGNDVASSTSREYIIKKAVERMKEEISFDTLGVLSITMPDGEIRTGDVTITLEELKGEPIISPKLSAFNVNFGEEQNTACEGNDPRLSDARKPLPHTHSISDITGLEGMLSTFTGKINRIDGLLHNHNNGSLLNSLTYSGDKTVIDLSKIDTLENDVNELVEQIRNDIVNYEQLISYKIQSANQDVSDIRNQISDLSRQVTEANSSYYTQAKDYADNKISDLQALIDSKLESLATTDNLNAFLDMANNTYSLVGSMVFDLDSVITIVDSQLYYSVDIPIDENIITELDNRVQNLSQCQIEAIMEYIDTNNEKQYCILPYIIIQDHALDGALRVSTSYANKKIHVTLDTSSGTVPDLVKDSRIIYNVYSKKPIVL